MISWDGLPQHIKEPDPNIYLSHNYVVLDAETTIKDNGDSRNEYNKLIVACWRRGRSHVRGRSLSSQIIGSEFDMQEMVEDIMLADFVVAHSTQFELGWLRRCGIELCKVVPYCSQIGEYVLAGNRPWGLSLEDCANRRGFRAKDFVGNLIRNGVDTELIPISLLTEYCHKDVAACERVFLHQREHLNRRGLLPVTYTRNITTPVLVDIMSKGMQLDADRVNRLHKSYNKKYIVLEEKFNKLTGGINWNSPKQKQEYIYGTLKFAEVQDHKGNPIRTKAGGKKTDGDTLLVLGKKAKTKQQKEFIEILLELNKYGQALSKILNKYKECVDNNDGRLFGNLHQTRTATHRLSSTGHGISVQFQNINREFKCCIKPSRVGWKIVENDEAQLEFRSAVQQCKDKQGLEDIHNKVDAHRQTFSKMYPADFQRLKDKQGTQEYEDIRQASKAHTFKPLYGGEYGTDAQQKYYRFFKTKYNGITEGQQIWFNRVFEFSYLTTFSGLIFHWPGAEYNKWGKIAVKGKVVQREICNYPIQSLCGADIVPIGLVYLWHKIKANNMKAFIINTVHDSVIAEVPEKEVEKYTEIAELSLTEDVIQYMDKVYKKKFIVPLEAETKVFDHWADYGQFEELINE